MSGAVPQGPLVDSEGRPTEPFRRLLQALTEATGYPYDIQVKRVSDTAVKIRLKGADGTWRESADITLS